MGVALFYYRYDDRYVHDYPTRDAAVAAASEMLDGWLVPAGLRDEDGTEYDRAGLDGLIYAWEEEDARRARERPRAPKEPQYRTFQGERWEVA